MALTAQQVQQFYIGYYGRPADPVGLTFWQTQTEDQALAGFASSDEFTNQFTGLSTSQQVTKVYGNLLGRAPDTAGLLYWSNEITAGRETIGSLVLSMIKNALGKDVTTIEDRVTYSTAFTAALDTAEEINAYAGAKATQTARDALLKVVATAVGDHTALNTETAKIDATIATIVSGGSTNPGQTFTLTQGVDVFNLDNGKATNGDDTYVAADHNRTAGSPQSIFGLGDDVDGGAGTNKLVVLGDISLGTIQVAKFKNMQKAELTSDSVANQNTDLTSLVAGGLQNLTVVEGGGLTANGINKSIVTGVKGAALAGDTGVLFNYVDAATPADAAKLVLEGATGSLPNVARNVTTTGIESLTVQASGVSNVALADGNLTSLTVEATGRTTLNLASGFVNKIDASASTATTVIDATARAGVLDYKGGTGADRVVVSNGGFTNVNSKFDGGDGADNLALSASFNTGIAAQLAAVNKLTGFEQFTVRGAGNTADINAGAVTSVKKFGFENTGAINLSNVSSDNSFVVNGVQNGAGTTVQMKTGQTVLNLDINSAAGGAGLNTVLLNDVQTLNLASNMTAANHAANQFTNVFNFATTNFTVKVTGDQNLVLGENAKQTAGTPEVPGFTSKVNVDAGAFTGRLTAHGSNDADVIKGGSGNDTIRGGFGGDELAGNGGNDTFVVAFGGAVSAGTPADPSVTEIKVTNANDVSSVSIDMVLDGVVQTLVVDSAAVAAATNATQLAAALQAGLRAAISAIDPAYDTASISVVAKDATTVTLTDAAGRDILEASLAVLRDNAVAAVAPAPDAGANVVVTNGAEVVTSETVVTINDELSLTSFDLWDDAGNSIFGGAVSITLGSNINQIAAALQAVASIRVTVTATAAGTLKFVNVYGDGFDEGSLVTTGSAAFANEVAAGNVVTPSTVVLTPSDITDVSSITITLAGVTKTVPLADTAWADDASFAAALQIALQTAFDANVTVADSGGATDNEVTITDGLGRSFGNTVVVTDEGSAAVPATADGGAAATEVNAGAEAIPSVGVVSSESNIAALDTITDFVKGTDKIDLVSFDNVDVGAPTKAWFAGDVTATAGANNLAGALALAISDVNGSSQTGSVALGANEAVFFMYGGNTYALVNDADAGYSASNDVLIKLTGSLGLTEGAVNVADFFA